MGAAVREVLLVVRAKNEAFRAINDIGQAFRMLDMQGQSFRKSWNNAFSPATSATMAKQQQTLAGIGAIAGVVTFAVGHKIVGAYRDAAEATMAYETVSRKTWSQIGADSKVTLDQIKKIGDEVAASYGHNAETIQATMFEVISSLPDEYNDSAEKIKSITDSIAMGATAGFASIDLVGHATISMMNTFGKEAGNAETIIATMHGAAKRSAVDLEDFASVLGRGAASAKNAGQSFETYVRLVGHLTNKGLSPAMAVTSLARAFDSVAKSKVVERMKVLNIDVVDANDNFQDMGVIVQSLNKRMKESPEVAKQLFKAVDEGMNKTEFKKWFKENEAALQTFGVTVKDEFNDMVNKIEEGTRDMGEAQRSAFMEELFKGAGGTIQAMRAWRAMLSDAALGEGEGGLFDALNIKAGEDAALLARDLETALNDPANKLERSQRKLETATKRMGEAMIPYLTTMAELKGGAAELFNDMPGWMQKLAAFGGLGLGVALETLGAYVTLLSASRFIKATKALNGMAQAQQAMNAASAGAGLTGLAGAGGAMARGGGLAKLGGGAALASGFVPIGRAPMAGSWVARAAPAAAQAGRFSRFAQWSGLAGLAGAARGGLGAVAGRIPLVGGLLRTPVTRVAALGRFGAIGAAGSALGAAAGVAGAGVAGWQIGSAIEKNIVAPFLEKRAAVKTAAANLVSVTVDQFKDFNEMGKLTKPALDEVTQAFDALKEKGALTEEAVARLGNASAANQIRQLANAGADVRAAMDLMIQGVEPVITRFSQFGDIDVTTLKDGIFQIAQNSGLSAEKAQILYDTLNTLKTASPEQLKTGIQGLATSLGISEQQAKDLLVAIGALPEKKETKHETKTTGIQNVLSMLSRIPRNIVTEHVIRSALRSIPIVGRLVPPSGTRRRDHEGGFIRMHTGGHAGLAQFTNLYDPEVIKAISMWGTLKANEVPTILEQGEFVIRKRAVQRMGISLFDRLNRMHEGGPVPALNRHREGSTTERGDITFNVYGHQMSADEIVNEAEWMRKTRGW